MRRSKISIPFPTLKIILSDDSTIIIRYSFHNTCRSNAWVSHVVREMSHKMYFPQLLLQILNYTKRKKNPILSWINYFSIENIRLKWKTHQTRLNEERERGPSWEIEGREEAISIGGYPAKGLIGVFNLCWFRHWFFSRK